MKQNSCCVNFENLFSFVLFSTSQVMNAMTNQKIIHEFGNIKSGQSVFFHSAGGGVGIALTQLTKLINNLTVIGTCSKNKFGALKHHVKHLYDESGSADYVPEIKKYSLKI